MNLRGHVIRADHYGWQLRRRGSLAFKIGIVLFHQPVEKRLFRRVTFETNRATGLASTLACKQLQYNRVLAMAFVRLATGVTLTNPDRVVQFGYETTSWSTIASITNGSGGGPEYDTGKHLSVVTSFVGLRGNVWVDIGISG